MVFYASAMFKTEALESSYFHKSLMEGVGINCDIHAVLTGCLSNETSIVVRKIDKVEDGYWD